LMHCTCKYKAVRHVITLVIFFLIFVLFVVSKLQPVLVS